ncbi:Putative Phosphoribosyltransferase domain, phosphoribosyl pyrophosphate synthetase [Septoria linicola]|uniref:Ribose-phosphate pyrophosphokinase 1 n=1 Tax=Septoria linicola TaxID=215465 RepID=A0A9Q9AR56_9PEZI|nr:putative Phosphoribosyltransferase domain, phosphoribosyl pyrophosphate synthetase [Septoria linicola]USW53034.1 Putative Phosphoribosyltransferase domain, phosphoribosyl pyrophosphate synthetase [Septoria linicola]
MRGACIFSGSSHPHLVEAICERLGQKPAQVDLKKFANGETSVEIKTSVRDQDVFIVQSGSSQINDNVMEMLIMINACKGGSARSITAVMPYFPYSRQSKKKSHRGAITARMLANLMKVAGVDHVITIDLHATQMQGFFKCPVDNLFAEPLLGKWIRMHIPEWWETVVVSKNPGGTKRVTSLADKLGLSFGIVTTDRRKRTQMSMSMYNSAILDTLGNDGTDEHNALKKEAEELRKASLERNDAPKERDWAQPRQKSPPSRPRGNSIRQHTRPGQQIQRASTSIPMSVTGRARGLTNGEPSPLAHSHRPDTPDENAQAEKQEPAAKQTGDEEELTLRPARTLPTVEPVYRDDDGYEEPEGDEDNDDHARDVITGRLVHGHIVDDDVPSPSASQYSEHRGHRSSSDDDNAPDHMTQSILSAASSRWVGGHGGDGGLGGTGDATHSDEEEEEALVNPEIETHVTLVGSVRDKPVVIVDDMIDKAGSWIAAAETVVKRGSASRVYCMATHGLFGGDSLEQLEECQEIEAIIVTNAFPIPEEKRLSSKKLVVLDVSSLLAEAIRRNHHGESISQLYYIMNE